MGRDEGWADIPEGDYKRHYFRDFRSLCGHWPLDTRELNLVQDERKTRQHCKTCWRRYRNERVRGYI